ncbi:M24 family metallopeptidase [Acididesulfobacillus acetoxydans]|uniref:M24 family metallopeptidase n=1 Tax=Acididesulfobacillus acetoxydans TaxID=1561005 RepID=UPI001F0EBC76|nr:M24 family metallopeptidase [Acididesulfobacillus acetoxydans]
MEREVQDKLGLVRKMLARLGYDGVFVESPLNLAWLTAGRFFVNITAPLAGTVIWIGSDESVLIANNIEASRLWLEEGIAGACNRILSYPWYEESRMRELKQSCAEGWRTATDGTLSEEFQKLRLVLNASEEARFASLGQMAAQALESVCQVFEPGETEFRVAGRLSKACQERGLEPVLCLVGADARALAYRHPLPTANPVERYAVIALGARKWGLVASLTRAVHFGPLPGELRERQEAVVEVDAVMISASRPGTRLNRVLRSGAEAYARLGYPGEWTAHHQGGVAGYQSREIKATPESTFVLAVDQALAWNPSIRGTKSEDTILLGANGPRMLTRTELFPEVVVTVGDERIARPLILER